MAESFEIAETVPASPAEVYAAWIDSAGHGRMTGAGATSQPRVGGAFTAWDGYIFGSYDALEPGRRILMEWRTTEFPVSAPDSLVEVLLDSAPGGTTITLRHDNIPDGQAGDYRQGWIDYYFTPMKAHFSS